MSQSPRLKKPSCTSVTISKKINHLTNNLRRIWPKYDTRLSQNVSGTEKITTLIEHAFKDSMLSSDFNNLALSNDDNNLQKLIQEEAKYGHQNFDSNQTFQNQEYEVVLNQAQILNVIKRYYGDPSALDPNPSTKKNNT